MLVPQAALAAQGYTWFLHLEVKKKTQLFPGSAQAGVEALKNLACSKAEDEVCRVAGAWQLLKIRVSLVLLYFSTGNNVFGLRAGQGSQPCS